MSDAWDSNPVVKNSSGRYLDHSWHTTFAAWPEVWKVRHAVETTRLKLAGWGDGASYLAYVNVGVEMRDKA